jgi:hypothetical protein
MKIPNTAFCLLTIPLFFYACNRNEFAPEIANQTFTIEENSPAGTIIGTVEADDQDDGQPISFEIIDGNLDGTFHINESSGILTVADPANLDYESSTSFTFSVSASDNHKKNPLESSAVIQIVMTDVKEITDGLIAHYSFSGNAANDLAGGNNGNVFGAGLVPDHNGIPESAYLFDGIDDYITLPNILDFHERSISFSFKAEEFPTYDYVNNSLGSWRSLIAYDFPGMSSAGFRVGVTNYESENKIFAQTTGMDLTAFPENYSGNLSVSTWHHCTLTMTADSIRLYLDGSMIGAMEIGNIATSTTGDPNIHIGTARYPALRFFKGGIDDIYLHNRALEAWEIESFHQEK